MNKQYSHSQPKQGTFLQCLQGTWADKSLLLTMLLACFVLWFKIDENLSHGVPTAYVYHQNQLLAAYPLPSDNQVIHVQAEGEIGVSDIEISKQGIRFVSSPCTTHYCMLAGHKLHAGSVLACVPNHIMVVLRGSLSKSDENMHFDAISE